MEEGTNNNLTQMAGTVLLQEHLAFVGTWLESATKNEIKGLKVACAIVKHQGTKRFKPATVKNEISLGTSAEQLQKKYLKSYYATEYCTESAQQTSESDILKYRKLSELKCSSVLNKSALFFIENWLGLNDEKVYQSVLLIFLRGIYSVVKTGSAVPSSSHRDNFAWFSKEDQKRTAEVSKILEKPVEVKKKSNRRAHSLNVDLIAKPAKIESNSMEYKQRALQGMKGNGKIMNWISNVQSINSSLYQDSFVTQYYKQKPVPKADFHTSIVFRLLPNK